MVHTCILQLNRKTRIEEIQNGTTACMYMYVASMSAVLLKPGRAAGIPKNSRKKLQWNC